MAKFRTHYDNLKVARKAPIGVIKAAYKVLCQIYHPDKYEGRPEQAHQVMKLINEAYAVLSDPIKRAEHDRWIDKKIRQYTSASSAKETDEERPSYKTTTGESPRNNDTHNNSTHPNNTGSAYSSENYRNNASTKKNSWVA